MNPKPWQPDSAAPCNIKPQDDGGAIPAKNIPLIDDIAPLSEDLDPESLDIPILTDIHNTAPQKTASSQDQNAQKEQQQQPLFNALPLPGGAEAEHIEHIVDELVFEYLPRIEQELRIRLYDYLSNLHRNR